MASIKLIQMKIFAIISRPYAKKKGGNTCIVIIFNLITICMSKVVIVSV